MLAKPTPAHAENIYEHVGRELRSRRERLHLTQGDVAKAVGISRTSVTNIESGRQALLLHQLQKFSDVLNVEMSDLLKESIKANLQPQPDYHIPSNVSDLVAKVMSKT